MINTLCTYARNALVQVLWLSLGLTALSSKASLVIYSYTGTTANHDSSITAWFQFYSRAMTNGLVFSDEILQHSLLISGSILSMNGQYDHLLGGGLQFASSVPGTQNLPTYQSLVIQNFQTHYFVQSDHNGDPAVFIGGADGTGTIYTGQWSYGLPIPEPNVLYFLGLFVICAVLCPFGKRANNRVERTGICAWDLSLGRLVGRSRGLPVAHP